MTNAEYVAGLRAVADWYEQNPEIELPSGEIVVGATDTKEVAAQIMRATSPCIKQYSDDIFIIKKKFGVVDLKFLFYRDKVCTRRVVRTEEVAAEIVPEKIIPAHTKEIVEWDCASILADEKA